jgi:hypothetical protein
LGGRRKKDIEYYSIVNIITGQTYVANAAFSPNVQDYSINLTVSIYGLGKMFKIDQ